MRRAALSTRAVRRRGSALLGLMLTACHSGVIDTDNGAMNRDPGGPMATNRYLEGNYGPVREELTVADLPVTGTIPDHLDGRYLRNGPNPVVDADPATYHWFLGTGMVHGVRIRDGKAEWYRNRFVRAADVADALGEPRHPGPVHAGFDFSANTHVIGHAGRTFAIVEGGGRPYELTDELDTVGPCDFDGTLPGGYTAHSKRDPVTGELHAVSYFFGWANKVQYSVIGVDGRVRRTVDIEVTGSPMMHDFSLTDSHVIIYDLPVTFDAKAAVAGVPRLFRGPARLTSNLMVGKRRIPERMAAGKVLESRSDDQGQEFPRVDERLVGKRHRYGYTVGFAPNGDGDTDLTANTLLKHDLTTGKTASRSFGPNTGASEFVFSPTSP